MAMLPQAAEEIGVRAQHLALPRDITQQAGTAAGSSAYLQDLGGGGQKSGVVLKRIFFIDILSIYFLFYFFTFPPLMRC
jgi:hypothetical protein